MTNPFSVLMGNQQNPMAMLQQLKQNPAQFLMWSKFNVPQEMMGDPDAIVNHLVQSGQISQDQYNRARQMAQKFSGR